MRGTHTLYTYWLAETLRLREALWGPLEDANEVRRARAEGNGFTDQIVLRAAFLARREHLDQSLEHWVKAAKIAFIGMLLLSILAGAGTALGALGDGLRSVNLPLALLAMLGFNCLAFVFWLLSFVVKNDDAGVWLGHAWLWSTQKLARGPDAVLAPRALIELLSRNGALRWTLSSISNGLWFAALLSLLLTLLTTLSARRYGFNWETTLLSPDTFVSLTNLVGWLPAQLGFAIPPEHIVRASNGLNTLPESAQTLWSQWLIGCVVVYGVIPRLGSLILSVLMARKNIATLDIDENLPAYANLRKRLQPASEVMGIDAPATDGFQTHIQHPLFEHDISNRPLLVGVELPPDTSWPPESVDESIRDLGIIDTGKQRKALLDHLQQYPPAKLLLACDARQTPDRGTIRFLADAASLAYQTHVVLILQAASADHPDPRTDTWHERLDAAGFSAEQRHTQLEAALRWLQHEQGQAHAKH